MELIRGLDLEHRESENSPEENNETQERPTEQSHDNELYGLLCEWGFSGYYEKIYFGK